MSVNKEREHVYLLPEDDADKDIALGFIGHFAVRDEVMQILPVARGWPNVLREFVDVYVPHLRNYRLAHIVLLIDFDGQEENRRAQFIAAIPAEFSDRVFLLGALDEPEVLKREMRLSLEKIGSALAGDCDAGTLDFWGHIQLKHNDSERARLATKVAPFLMARR